MPIPRRFATAYAALVDVWGGAGVLEAAAAVDLDFFVGLAVAASVPDATAVGVAGTAWPRSPGRAPGPRAWAGRRGRPVRRRSADGTGAPG